MYGIHKNSKITARHKKYFLLLIDCQQLIKKEMEKGINQRKKINNSASNIKL